METIDNLVQDTLECMTDLEGKFDLIDKIKDSIINDSYFYQDIRNLIIEYADRYID